MSIACQLSQQYYIMGPETYEKKYISVYVFFSNTVLMRRPLSLDYAQKQATHCTLGPPLEKT